MLFQKIVLTLSLTFLINSTFQSFPTYSPTFSSYSEEESIDQLYHSINFKGEEKPDHDLFHRAVNGYYQLDEAGQLSEKAILTIIDFRRSGNEKRFWAIDLKNQKMLYHTLVAHGRNSGNVYASKFSNIPNSNQSSLGFYVTGKTYKGKHGLSLKLHGVEQGINDKAEARAIVMHGAEYVSDTYINRVGRLGRSFGCPAVPMELHEEIISQLADGTCLFIYYPEEEYLSTSAFNTSHSRSGKFYPAGFHR